MTRLGSPVAIILCALAATAAAASTARAQYPTRVVKIVSPAPPGGNLDIVARFVQPGLQAILKQPVIVESHGGAGGYIGSDYVAKAQPDGYTLLLAGVFTATGPMLQKHPSYDPGRDLVPVAILSSAPNVLVAGPHLKANSVAELIAEAKAHPGKLNIGSNGVGTAIHLSAELFKLRTGIAITHVAYRGWADCVLGLMNGEVDMMFDNVSTALPNILAGKTRALAVTSPRRHRKLPDVPTLDEVGIHNSEVSSWFGIMAPAGTPKPVLDTLGRAFKAISETAQFRQAIDRQGMDIAFLGPDEAAKFWRDEIAKWGGVVRDAHLTAEN
jgi:tripartite-type tricarboxylate transporter receptor subunit TctC